MRDVLGTIQADQDAIIRAGSRGALVVDGGPGTGKTVVALHRAAYLVYSDPHLGEGRGGVLFVGPSPAYLSYVEDVLPSLGEDSVQTCTLRDLVAEGSTAAVESDPAARAPQGRRAHDRCDRARRPPVRGAADRASPHRDAVGRAVAEPAGLGGGLRVGRTRHAAQRGSRPGVGDGARHPHRPGRRRGGAAASAAPSARPQRGADARLRPRLAAGRGIRSRLRPLERPGLPAPMRSLAHARPGRRAAAHGRHGLDHVGPAAARCRPAPTGRPCGIAAPAAARRAARPRAGVHVAGRRATQRGGRRDDAVARRRGSSQQPRRRVRARRRPTRTCWRGRSRTS